MSVAPLFGDPEIDALSKCICICIAASKCPTCGAQADTACKSSSGKVVPSHVTRMKAGHKLCATPIEDLVEKYMKECQA